MSALTDEMVRLFETGAGFGATSAIARELGVTPTAVARWAKGVNAPHSRYFAGLEGWFGLKAGHLAAVEAGKVKVGAAVVARVTHGSNADLLVVLARIEAKLDVVLGLVG